MGIDQKINLPREVWRAITDIASEEFERDVLAKAFWRGRSNLNYRLSLDSSPISTVCRAFSDAAFQGAGLRRHHRITQEVVKLSLRQIAFGSPPDEVREEFSRFCHLMYLGYQQRFLNRHPGEEPEQFLDRARKMTFNWTRLIVDTKSTLYLESPVRELDKATPDYVRERLEDVWNDEYNRVLLEADRYARLVGTVSVRPFYDPDVKGKIRLWAFLSHQLRVIPDERRPWKPLAVIERHNPFDSAGMMTIWTDRAYLVVSGSKVVEASTHELGRIPHTFFKDRISFQSFFVEGEGRSVCETNGTINDKISDLNEIIQFQGFSTMEVINPAEDNPVIGPRRSVVFRPPTNTVPFGIRFAAPNAPISDLAADIDNNIKALLQVSRVPEAAVGLQLGRRSLSGVAIQAAWRPILDDNKQRMKVFAPAEVDLTDSVLRVLNEHDPEFTYDPVAGRAGFSIRYVEPQFPVDLRSRLEQEQFDVQQAITTPPKIMMERDPSRFSSIDQAEEEWKRNIKVITEGGRPIPDASGSNQPMPTPEDAPGDREGNGQIDDLDGFTMDELRRAFKDEGIEIVGKEGADESTVTS